MSQRIPLVIAGSIYFFGLFATVWLSRKQLVNPKTHGFFRFFAFVCILTLWLIKIAGLGTVLLELPDVVAQCLLLSSVLLVLTGYLELKLRGRPSKTREDATLFAFEKTTKLVTTGIFRVIRHPMYASLLCLAWGLLTEYLTVVGLALAFLATYSLYRTARADERECLFFFGDEYVSYMQRTWAFLPFVF